MAWRRPKVSAPAPRVTALRKSRRGQAEGGELDEQVQSGEEQAGAGIGFMFQARMEDGDPKAEIRKKSEIRNPNGRGQLRVEFQWAANTLERSRCEEDRIMAGQNQEER
jgi:hypothetical protein